MRILLFERASLVGPGGGVRCAVVDLSAVGARLSLSAHPPRPPLRLEFELGGEALTLAVEILRASDGEDVAVAFIDPPLDRLHRLIIVEQRLAIAAGRANVRERRLRRGGGARGEVLPTAEPGGGLPRAEPGEVLPRPQRGFSE